jgi:pilus assembly protein Flp/PilA
MDRLLAVWVALTERATAAKNDERGVTAIEYGLLAVLIALVMAGGATILGDELEALFTRIGESLNP